MKHFILAALVTATPSLVSAGAFFISESSFLSAIQSPYYLEQFSGFGFGSPLNGAQTSYNAPGANGYGWTASADNGLYSNFEAITLNNANQRLTITFSSPVTAVGGIVANTDISGNLLAGTVTMTISDGATQSVIFSTATSGFLGYTNATPFTSISLIATNAAIANNWVQVAHFYTGSAGGAPLLPPRITKLTVLVGSNRLDTTNLPSGNNIVVESGTNLLTWTTNLTVLATNSVQSIFVPADASQKRFYRLKL